MIVVPADHGAVGRISNETVQRLSESVHMVLRAHGQRYLVARSSIIKMSESNGATNVPKAVHTCDTTLETVTF
jgi:hypothetical protein